MAALNGCHSARGGRLQLVRGLKMAAAGEDWAPSAEVKAVAAGWMLEFSCCCLCRHFGDGCLSEFQRWSDVAHGEGWQLLRF